MVKFNGNIEVNKSIEECFKLFNLQEQNVKKLDPYILFSTPQEITENHIGSTFLQGRDLDGKINEILITVADYKDEEKLKLIESTFNLDKSFKITYAYNLEYIDAKKTKITYTTSTEGLKFFSRMMLKFIKVANEAQINVHLTHIKEVLEN